ncbi:HmuY family protein [Flavobacterium sp.]|jgi:hypothetical protein|uniref:HmuY family protein n=1 Tax=Flavobacterium sp. TaxID=239 RepID=UPI003784B7B3
MYKSFFLKSVLVLSVVSLLTSCSDDDNNATNVSLETKTFSNLYAPQTGGQGQPVGGAFTKFSFSQNTTVTDDSWDIAFRGTTIIVNGGSAIGITDEPTRTGNGAVSIVTNTLDAVTTIPDVSSFVQDATNAYAIPTGSGNGWYNYNSTTNLITSIAGKVFVVKTHDGKYAKMEIISYYKDAPATPDATALSRYYTFRYVYQPNGTSF